MKISKIENSSFRDTSGFLFYHENEIYRIQENYIIYNCTKYRDAKSEIAINFNDKKLKIRWPVKKALVSQKDRLAISFNEYLKNYVFKK